MTIAPAETRPEWWRRIDALDALQYGILAFIVLSSLAGAFTHMHDWTREALPNQKDWLCWVNAVISELLPTSAFLSIRKRQRERRSISVPVWIFIGSALLSLCAQLSATGVRLPGDVQFLACLPAIAVLILSKVIFGDAEHARKRRERSMELARKKERTVARRAEHAAELARRDAELAAEHAAELARRDAELAAELAAERERERLRIEAEAQAERTRIEQAAMTERERLAADERRAEREARERREARESEARLAIEREQALAAAVAEAERLRIEAEGRAARERAEAERIAAEAEALRLRTEADERARRDAERLLTDHEAQGGNDDEATAGRRRMSRSDRRKLVDVVLAALPEGTPRDVAVARVAARLNITDRYAREFVPEDWADGSSASSSAGGEAEGGQRRHLVAVGGR